MAAQSTADRVAQSFLDGKKDRSGAFVSTGDELRTYSVMLAWRDKEGYLHTTPELHRKYSKTTTRHQKAVYAVISPRIGTQGKD